MKTEQIKLIVDICRKEFDRKETTDREAQKIINVLSELSYLLYKKNCAELHSVIASEVSEMYKDIEYVERPRMDNEQEMFYTTG